jgi:threonine dehydrogenase-like Zn-dependent dehydrogenase
MPSNTMEAIQFDKKKEQILLIKAPQPTAPIRNEVIVKVAYAGICGTDLHIAEVWQSHLSRLMSMVGSRI